MSTFRPGQRVRLEHTNDPHTDLRPGDTGTVRRHDEQQQTVYVDWDSGSTLSMCLDAGDRITAVPGGDNTAQPEVASWATALRQLRNAGAVAGATAADWWAQDIIGGRATGDVRPAARRVLTGIKDGDPAVLDTLPGLDLFGQEAGSTSEADLYTDAAGDVAAWESLNDHQREEAIDAYRDTFDTAVLTRVTELCGLASSPTGRDVSYLHPDKVRIGSVGVFSGDWAWTEGSDGSQRIGVGFVGTLIDRWNGWAVFSCTRPVAEAIVADQRHQRDEYQQSLRDQGVPEADLNQQVGQSLADLRFDGDVIVADQRAMYDDPQAIERIEADIDGRYVVMGWNWCWDAVDPYACDRIVGDLPEAGEQQQFEMLRHTPGMRVPHNRLYLRMLRLWPVSGDLAYVAALMLDDQRIGTVGNDGASGGTDVVLTHPETNQDLLSRYLAGCRYQGRPVTMPRLMDALADEYYLAQAVAQSQAEGAGQLRLVDDTGHTLSLRPVRPAPRGWAELSELGRRLAAESGTAAATQWLIWTGTHWMNLPHSSAPRPDAARHTAEQR
ncbi:DUF4314 domain-containing protein [Paractinoplanes toevensis]|uniref:DUF4314 domain-containing protein n=1 Tax=Paractinoplanes toevensis TaxID=571911 RepID=A0A919T923_9ACTN|nr:DUF4314 domain-containing protein [Actinoplanes toevensis]GIM90115.1 hypothetical protein Ato02nite_019080 [Actinoplanes toevensis]